MANKAYLGKMDKNNETEDFFRKSLSLYSGIVSWTLKLLNHVKMN
jgi:hypothetical protein